MRPMPEWAPYPHCEVGHNAPDPAGVGTKCWSEFDVVVPLPGGTCILACAVHARHLERTL